MNEKSAKNTSEGDKTTIDLKKDTAFLKKSKKYAEIYIKQKKDNVMKKILQASNYDQAKELVGRSESAVKNWSDIMRLNILLNLIVKHSKSKRKNSDYTFNLDATSMKAQNKLPNEFKIGKDTPEEKANYKKNPLHPLITGVDRLLKQKRANEAYGIIMGAGDGATLKSKSDKLKHAIGKVTQAELECAKSSQNDADEQLLNMLNELLKQDISEFETTIKGYDKYDSRKFDVVRSFLYKLIEESTTTDDSKKKTLETIISRKQTRFTEVFDKSNITDQNISELLINIRDTIHDSQKLQTLLEPALNEQCFNTFISSVNRLSNRLFTLKRNKSILDNLKQCKESLDKTLQNSTTGKVATNLKETLNALNDNVVDHMIKLTKTNKLPYNELQNIPNKLDNINNKSKCGQTLINYFNSVRTLYAKMKLYYSIYSTLVGTLSSKNAYKNLTNRGGSLDDIYVLIKIFKTYKKQLEVQGYGAVNTFISTLEKKLTTSEKQSSDSEVLSDEKQSSDSEVLSENFKNAKKLFGDYSVGNTIKDAIESMYNCYEAYMTQ